jgi:hypothetical protein
VPRLRSLEAFDNLERLVSSSPAEDECSNEIAALGDGKQPEVMAVELTNTIEKC